MLHCNFHALSEQIDQQQQFRILAYREGEGNKQLSLFANQPPLHRQLAMQAGHLRAICKKIIYY